MEETSPQKHITLALWSSPLLHFDSLLCHVLPMAMFNFATHNVTTSSKHPTLLGLPWRDKQQNSQNISNYKSIWHHVTKIVIFINKMWKPHILQLTSSCSLIKFGKRYISEDEYISCIFYPCCPLTKHFVHESLCVIKIQCYIPCNHARMPNPQLWIPKFCHLNFWY